ncbi:hypothetical protein GA0115241_101858 [Streptomyces sp. DpondAA-D4]|nr:hypothetical protein GA0115241_101858 [Streptomyces sp. DpondAA-D4]
MPRTARSVSGRGVRSEERDVRRGCHPQQLHPVQGRRRPSTKSGSDAPRVTGQIKPGRSRRPERRGAPAAPNPLAVTSLHAQYRPTVATGPVATSLTEAEVWSALFAGSVLTEAQTHQFALCAITCPRRSFGCTGTTNEPRRADLPSSSARSAPAGASSGCRTYRRRTAPNTPRWRIRPACWRSTSVSNASVIEPRCAAMWIMRPARGGGGWNPTPALPPPTHQSSRYEPSRSRRQGPPSPVDPVQTVVHQARELGARDRGPGEDESRLRRSGEGRVNETVLRTVGLHRGPVLRIGRGPQGGQCLQ